jgi:hypothetical protein
MNQKSLVNQLPEKPTRADLFLQGTRIIEEARPNKGRKTDNVDTVSARDQTTRAISRSKLLTKFQADDGLKNIAGSEPAEGLKALSSIQTQQSFADVVKDLLKNFRQEKSEFSIVIAVVRHNIDYCNHKALSEHCNIGVNEVRRARDRIKYYVKNRYPDGLESIE